MKDEQQDQSTKPNQQAPSPVERLWSGIRTGAGHVSRACKDLVYPPVCENCYEQLVVFAPLNLAGNGRDTAPLCHDCKNIFLRQRIDLYCQRCGGPAPLAGQEHCPRCPRSKIHFDRVIPLGRYQDELRIAILRMKAPSGALLANAVGNLLGVHRREELLALEPDVIIPVPVFWRRRWQMGPGSTSAITDALGACLRIPIARNILRCRRNTKKQSLLSYRARLKNVKGAYIVRRLQAVKGRRILVIDDIMTTGATINEVSRQLKAAGAARVVAAVVARAVDAKGS